MPSFDIVSETDMQEVDNVVNNVKRTIEQRYDFKGTNCSLERTENDIKIIADDQYKLDTIAGMLKENFVRRKLDPKALDFGTAEKASGNNLRQVVKVKQGIDKDTAKDLVKKIKDSKLKVQASIRGEEVRVEGKKRDDLQEVIALLRNMETELPLQYINFRD